jgi:hypothetical protein
MKIVLILLLFLFIWCWKESTPTNESTTVNNTPENILTPWDNQTTPEKTNLSGETIQEEVTFHTLDSQSIEDLKKSSQEIFIENNTFTQNNTWFEISPEKDISTSDFINSYEIKGQASFWNE